MLADFHLETLLATGYALLLLVIAAGLQMMGRHSHRRAGLYHNRGFRFHKTADHWECPHGARLERAEIDNELRAEIAALNRPRARSTQVSQPEAALLQRRRKLFDQRLSMRNLRRIRWHVTHDARP